MFPYYCECGAVQRHYIKVGGFPSSFNFYQVFLSIVAAFKTALQLVFVFVFLNYFNY